jgi:hypothetical protein
MIPPEGSRRRLPRNRVRIRQWHFLCFFGPDPVKNPIRLQLYLGAIWLLAIGAGYAVILKYQTNRGDVGDTPKQWPSQSALVLDPRRSTLIMFAHPQCPCTRASVEELNRLLVQCPGKVTAQVWFTKPDQFSDDWTQGSLWRSVAAIPSVTVHEDVGGIQAALFGAETSGYVVLYDPRGKLLFHGGITGSRGHAGDNAGQQTLISLITQQAAALSQTPVYGCSLIGTSQLSTKGAPE